MPLVSSTAVRSLSLGDLELTSLLGGPEENQSGDSSVSECRLDESDPVLAGALAAIDLGFAGVILSGAPGTGKSWYAQQVAIALAGNWEAVRSVQFHPSYQYEDFVFGYAPGEDGHFVLCPKEFAQICKDAGSNPTDTYVLVIDEMSRSDVVRVFGEALTYLEMDKRDRPFHLASGQELSVPRNLFIIGTMNPWDKGVDEMDVALERRFAQIEVKPDADVLRRLLGEGGASEGFCDKVVGFFEELQRLELVTVRLGHAYFRRCVDRTSAEHVWRLRVRPTLGRACRLEPELLEIIDKLWLGVVSEEVAEGQAGGEKDGGTEGSGGPAANGE